MSFLGTISLILFGLLLLYILELFAHRQLSKSVELFPNNRPFHEGKLTQRKYLTLFKYAYNNTYGSAIHERIVDSYPFREKPESMNVGHYVYQLGLF